MVSTRRHLLSVCTAIFVITALAPFCCAQVPGANSDPTYQVLRHIKVSSEAFEVKDLVLKRDAGTFTLSSGTLCLLEPVNGVVTGAIFKGTGSFELNTKDPIELAQLARLTKGQPMKEEFEKLVLRFADDTPDEIRKSPAARAPPTSLTA